MIFHYQYIEKNNNENAVESVLHGPRDDVKKVKSQNFNLSVHFVECEYHGRLKTPPGV